MGAEDAEGPKKSGRVYVPLDLSMTDEEVVAALREAAGLDPDQEPSVDDEENPVALPDHAPGD